MALQSSLHIDNTEIEWVGPSLNEGPLPAILYLALSAKDSLTLDPFNQPVSFLENTYRIRIFSLTLPSHEPPLEPQNALKEWAEHFQKGEDILTPFIDKLVQVAHFLHDKKIASSLGIAGLSRGGFLALHAASRTPFFSTILGFAPVTKLGNSKDFAEQKHSSLIQSFDLDRKYETFIDKTIRLYIGNRDERVSTAACFAFIEGLSETCYKYKRRSAQAELIISPSIGYLGHGTPLAIFQEGATWIAKQLQATPLS